MLKSFNQDVREPKEKLFGTIGTTCTMNSTSTRWKRQLHNFRSIGVPGHYFWRETRGPDV